MNRIETAIAKTRQTITDRLAAGLTTPEKVASLHKTLDMGLEEYCKFQEIKSLAVAEGKLTLEEGQQIYMFLGETPEHFNKQSVEVKSVLTRIFMELLQKAHPTLAR